MSKTKARQRKSSKKRTNLAASYFPKEAFNGSSGARASLKKPLNLLSQLGSGFLEILVRNLGLSDPLHEDSGVGLGLLIGRTKPCHQS